MPSSYRIFRVMGISVELHWTFILFFLFLLLFFGLSMFVFFFIIFSIVLAHELMHSITAKLSGIPVPRIVLLPIGGLANIELPENPILELKISIVGPLLNFFLAGVCFGVLSLVGTSIMSYSDLIVGLSEGTINFFSFSYLLNWLVWLNLVLALFNSLPAFPMDGGRIFRSVFALWIDYVQATEIAARFGQMIFLLLIIAGFIFGNPWWIIIGFFLSYAGGSELKTVELRRAFAGLSVGEISLARSKLPYVSKSMRVGDFIELMAKPDQRFYVVSDSSGSVHGVLDIQNLRNIPRSRLRDVKVGDFADVNYAVVDSNVKVNDSLHQILSSDFLFVVDGKTIVGYVTPESLSQMALFHNLNKKLGGSNIHHF